MSNSSGDFSEEGPVREELERLVNTLGLSVAALQPSAVRDAIKAELAACHPDRFGGDFPSAETRDRFHKLKEALDNIDRSNAVPAVRDDLSLQLHDLRKQLDVVLAVRDLRAKSEDSAGSTNSLKGQAQARYSAARLHSAVFAAISGFILTAWAFLKDNAIFEPIAKNPVIGLILGALFVGCGASFALLWFKEHQAARRVEWFLSDRGLAVVLRRLIGWGSDTEDLEVLFTKSELVDAIADGTARGSRITFLRGFQKFLQSQLSTPVVESIARQHIAELLEREVISQNGRRGIEQLYRLDQSAVKDLKSGHYYEGEY